MDHNHLCSFGGLESKAFSSQLGESPPPKPPRRRFSDQRSLSYLGNHPPKKYYEATQKSDSKIKRFIGKPVYLSLPASLTASVTNEYDDPFNLQIHASDPSDHSKPSKEKEFYRKYFLESLKFYDKKKACDCNKSFDKEKLQSVSQDFYRDNFFMSQCDTSVPFVVDKLFRNSCKGEKVISNTVVNCCKKSVYKNLHRRHSDPVMYNCTQYSDPALFCFNFLKDSALKFDWEHCCERMSHLVKKRGKFHDSVGNCSCCKKNYFIMQEIKNLREINEKLWQHLCSLQICLESRKKKTQDESADVSVSDLLSSIYYAQKAKDNAMEERLKIALEERDTALQEIDGLIYTLTRSCDCSDSEKEFNEDKKELLGEEVYAGNLPNVLKGQRMLLSQFNNFKGFKQDSSLSCQLKQVTSERNNALIKVKHLEEDIKNMKICFDLWHSDNKHWERTMLDVLNQIIHQRASVLSKADNELDVGNVKYRLDSFHQNVSPNESLSKTVESTKTYQSLSDLKQQHSLKTSDEVQKLKEEILLLNKALEGEKKKREQSEKKNFRLERLTHTLRKKLNGQDIGVHV